MITPELIATSLGGTRAGSGWLCRCPAHPDDRHSLSVGGPGKTQAIVINCKAGCTQQAVVYALAQMGLWENATPNPDGARIINAAPTQPEWTAIAPVPDDAPPPMKSHPKHGKPSLRYHYKDAAGATILYVDRFDHPDGSKDFCPQVYGQCLAERRWLRKLLIKPNPLYNLDKIASAPHLRVLLVEGEKCADHAETFLETHVPTTWIGGSNNVHNCDLAPLQGRHVDLWPDNDKPGRDSMHALATRLKNIAASVSLIRVPDTKPAKWDIADADPAEARALIAAASAPETDAQDEVDAQAAELHLTDLGNAERLMLRFGDDLRYCYQTTEWYVWSGHRWKPDDGSQVSKLMQETVRLMWREMSFVQDHEKRARYAKFANSSEGRNKLDAAISIARSQKPVGIETFDRGEYQLNIANGIVDLKTGALAPHDRNALLTKIIHSPYDKLAAAPTWVTFLSRIMDGNQDLVRFLQRAIGYSLTGSTQEQCLFLMHGTGQNGKSTFLQALKVVFGDYARQADATTFMANKFEQRGPRPDLVALRGARFVPAVEVEEGQRFAESLVKTLTGQDTISTRDLYGKQFEFVPQFKLWLAANHKPVIRGQDSGIWRRIRLIPFNAQIPPAERDANLLGKLIAEAPGILRWAIEGAMLWQKHGLGIPAEVEEATSSYRNECDRLAAFFDEACVLMPNASVKAQVLYKAYAQWCDESGERCEAGTVFGRRLEERKLQKQRKASGIFYVGIGLKADGPDDRFPD